MLFASRTIFGAAFFLQKKGVLAENGENAEVVSYGNIKLLVVAFIGQQTEAQLQEKQGFLI
jgi:hypothetical protein